MLKGEFIERKNRFTAIVNLNGTVIPVHVANSGRLRELLRPGAEVYLTKIQGKNRLTSFDLSLVNYRGILVSVDARMPNKVVADSINSGKIYELEGYRVLKREIKYGGSRLDMLLQHENQPFCYVEVKSVTLVTNGIARFPDAPTERGVRHLSELVQAVEEGFRAAAIFLIQREDAHAFKPNEETDGQFAEALRRAGLRGVEIYAYLCRIQMDGIELTKSVPVIL